MTIKQRDANLARAQDLRLQRAALRREVRARPQLLVDLMHDPPDCMRQMRLWDLLMYPMAKGKVRGQTHVELIAGAAIAQHINLARFVGDAPLEWRLWVASNAVRHARGTRAARVEAVAA